MAEDASSFPQWKGLFDWSMKFQDGTHETHFEEMDSDKQRWLGEVMKYHTQDFGKRMNVIAQGLSNTDDTEAAVQHKEELLEELIDICESIDFARELGKVGGLQCAISLVYCNHESLKWRAAELLAVCAQNNLPVQKEFLDAGVLQAAVSLLQQLPSLLQVKGLLLVSAMVRGCDEATLSAVEHNLPAMLAGLTSSYDKDIRVQRKSLQLLNYFCVSQPKVQRELVNIASICKCLPVLYSSEDADTARGALELSITLASHPMGRLQLQEAEALSFASRLESAILSKTGDDLEAAQDELDATKQLQRMLT